MRVIAGEARGRRLEALPGTDITRPTLDQVKEAMFSIVQFDLPGARVLDLYAGSGQLGIEALSRGAARCVFLDENREAVNIVMKNCKNCGVFDRSRVNIGEAARFLSACREQFDLVLLDPPFHNGTLENILPIVDKCVAPGGIVICESETKLVLPAEVGGIKVGMAAYTYATSAVNGRPSLNYEAEVTQVGLVNYFTYDNLDAFYSEMQSLLSQMRSDGAEATMLYIHWGTEYSLQADSAQRMIAQKMCDLGVDVIVGGHPHVVEPMELLTSSSDSRHKTAVIYSLGNAVSNQRRDLMTLNTGHTEDGAVFTVTFEKYADGGVYVADVNVMPTWVNLHSVDEKQEYNIVPLEDARRTEWQNLYGLDAAALANAVASYDRTMNIVGPGLEQCRSYYAQEKQAREAPVVPTEEAA